MSELSDFVAKLLHAHPHITAVATVLIGLSILASKVIAPRWSIPSKDAPWYVRAAHFVVVNLPAWGRALDGRTWAGITWSIPFLTWTLRDVSKLADEEPKKSSSTGFIDIGIMLCIATVSVLTFVLVFLLAGCAPGKEYVRALQVKGEVSDVVSDGHIAWSQIRQAMHDDIRQHATSLADGEQRLERLKQTEKRADDALIIGRESVRKFSEALRAAGAAKRRDWPALITEVIVAVTTMVAALNELGIHVNWAPPAVSLVPVLPAIQRGFDSAVGRSRKCYFFIDGRLQQVSCDHYMFALGGTK